MSRVGKVPIDIPDKVSVKLDKDSISVTGPKGELTQDFRQEVLVKQEENRLIVESNGTTKKHRSYHGLYRALINNMIIGVSEGYKKELEIQGVGYTAEMKGNNLSLSLGFSHPILFKPPEGITIVVPTKTAISITGIDKHLVGDVSAKIRSFRPPEPYKGKGIRYLGEEVRRKVGKTAG